MALKSEKVLRARYLLRFFVAFLNRFKIIIAISIVLGISVFFIIGLANQLFSGRNIQRIGVVGKYQSENLPYELLELIGDGLTSIDETGGVQPNLAEKWETPDKGKTWIFYLNNNKKWQNGESLKSSDILYNFRDLDTDTSNKSKIVFSLKDRFSPFPYVVSKPVFKNGLMGTDMWNVKKINLNGGIVSSLTLENGSRDRRYYKFYPTEESVKLAMKLGKIDQILEVYNPTPLNEWKTLNIRPQIKYNQVVTIFFNVTNDWLQDKTLRQALNYAVDKKGLFVKSALSPISPLSWAYNPQVKPYLKDQKKAAEIIAEIEKNTKKEISIDLVTSPSLLTVAETIATEWKKVGMGVNVLVSSTIPNEFQAYLAIMEIPKDPDQYYLWHSTQNSNISKYSNPRIDKLLEDGRAELDLTERKRIYLDFQRYLVEDSPAIFLYHPEVYNVIRD